MTNDLPRTLALAGRVAFISGAAGGIGRSIAIMMAERGADLGISDANAIGLEQTAELARAHGAEVICVPADFTQPDQISTAVNTVARSLGGLDILVNNLGVHERMVVSPDEGTYVEDLPDYAWDTVFTLNVGGTRHASRAAIPHLRARGGGVIISASSLAADIGTAGSGAYNASKAAIVSLTKMMATELGRDGIRVVCYAPTSVLTAGLTASHPLGSDPAALNASLTAEQALKRVGTPEDVARLVCFLASDEASFITGSSHTIDGGVMAFRGSDTD